MKRNNIKMLRTSKRYSSLRLKSVTHLHIISSLVVTSIILGEAISGGVITISLPVLKSSKGTEQNFVAVENVHADLRASGNKRDIEKESPKEHQAAAGQSISERLDLARKNSSHEISFSFLGMVQNPENLRGRKVLKAGENISELDANDDDNSQRDKTGGAAPDALAVQITSSPRFENTHPNYSKIHENRLPTEIHGKLIMPYQANTSVPASHQRGTYNETESDQKQSMDQRATSNSSIEFQIRVSPAGLKRDFEIRPHTTAEKDELEASIDSEVYATTPQTFRGVAFSSHARFDSLRVDNVSKLSYMTYRLIKMHHIRSMLDFSCINSLHWMPQMLQYLDLELPGFRYYCIFENVKDVKEVRERFGDQCSPEYFVQQDYWNAKVPEVDMVFLWNVVGRTGPMEAWTLLKEIRKSNSKYVIIPNYPNLKRNAMTGTRHGRTNVRRAPFLFKEPLRTINNMSYIESIPKQMLFYEAENLRETEDY